MVATPGRQESINANQAEGWIGPGVIGLVGITVGN